MTQPTEDIWYRINKGAAVHAGRPFKLDYIHGAWAYGLVDLGGIRGFATAQRGFRLTDLTPMAGPPKLRPGALMKRWR